MPFGLGVRSSWEEAWGSVSLGTETEFLIFEEANSPIWTPGPPRLSGPAETETLRALIGIISKMEGVVRADDEEVILDNGSKIYIDHPYLEHATAVQTAAGSTAALSTIAAEFAAERTIVAATRELRNRAGVGLQIYKTLTRDGEELPDISAGYHENYGLSRDLYFKLFQSTYWPRPVVERVLIPFLVTRSLLGGAGWIDPTGGIFHVSQRASYIDCVYNISTQVHHPILHLKRPLPDASRPRVHITSGDPSWTWDSDLGQPNMEAILDAAFRLSLTAGILVFAAEGLLDSLDLRMRNPVAAFRGGFDIAFRLSDRTNERAVA